MRVPERADGDARRKVQVASPRLVPHLATLAVGQDERRLPVIGIKTCLGEIDSLLLGAGHRTFLNTDPRGDHAPRYARAADRLVSGRRDYAPAANRLASGRRATRGLPDLRRGP